MPTLHITTTQNYTKHNFCMPTSSIWDSREPSFILLRPKRTNYLRRSPIYENTFVRTKHIFWKHANQFPCDQIEGLTLIWMLHQQNNLQFYILTCVISDSNFSSQFYWKRRGSGLRHTIMDVRYGSAYYEVRLIFKL